MNHPITFLDRDNRKKLVPASFPNFLELLWKILVITVIISLYYKVLIKLFYLHCSCKNVVQYSNKENLKVDKNISPDGSGNSENNQKVTIAVGKFFN